MENKTKAMTLSYELGEQFEWKKWANQIPFIKFPDDWVVQVIPPFAGAIARFVVKEATGNHKVSVYLDCYDMLGFNETPYWEIYPIDADDERNRFPLRCEMAKTGRLIDFISLALAVRNKE